MRGINIKFPINDDIVGGTLFKLNKTTKDALTSNLLLLLLTEKGERYYMPNYGTNLLRYVFEPGDDITLNDIRDDLNESVSTYMPNIKINDVSFNWFDQKNQQNVVDGAEQLNLKIIFVYTEDAFSETGEIEITF